MTSIQRLRRYCFLKNLTHANTNANVDTNANADTNAGVTAIALPVLSNRQSKFQMKDVTGVATQNLGWTPLLIQRFFYKRRR